jgi:hypothetical protein
MISDIGRLSEEAARQNLRLRHFFGAFHPGPKAWSTMSSELLDAKMSSELLDAQMAGAFLAKKV